MKTVRGNNRFVDTTVEIQVELRLPLEVDMEPDHICKHMSRSFQDTLIWISSTPVRECRTNLDLRMEPNRSGPDTTCCCLSPRNPVASYQGMVVTSSECPPRQCRLSTGIQQVKPTPDWFTFGLPTPVLRIPDRQFLGAGKQLEF